MSGLKRFRSLASLLVLTVVVSLAATMLGGVVSAAASNASPVPGAAPATAAGAAHPCARAVRRCVGTVRVPLDRADPRSPRIDVGFVFLPRSDRGRPALGTVFVNDGGPGAVIGASEQVIRSALGPVLRRRNLLLVDPRGFGRSTPQTCPSLDVGSDASIAACAARLGRFATNLTSTAHAADLDAVRAALRVAKLTLHGNSYGTLFAQAYSTRYPHRTEAVFLDSVVATRTDGYAENMPGEPFAAPIGVFDEPCVASRACRQANPRPQARLASLLTEVRAGRIPGVDAEALLGILNNVNDPVVAREVAAALSAAGAGDRAPLARLARAYPVPPAKEITQDLGTDFAAVLGYACSDYRHGFDRAAAPNERRRQLAALQAATRPLTPFQLQDLQPGLRRFYADWCANWPTPRQSPVAPAGAAHPSVPVLVVNGQLDITTPPAGAAVVAGRYPRARFVNVPFGDHASSLGSDAPDSRCVQGLMRSFLSAPHRTLSVPGCDGETLRALGRFPRTAAQLSPAVLREGPNSPAARRLVAAAHATAQDAVARLAPLAENEPGRQLGLRGGAVIYGKDGAVRLRGARFVSDVAVTGTVKLTAAGRARADLVVLTAGARHKVTLSWSAFVPADAAEVTGNVDGRKVRARVRLT